MRSITCSAAFGVPVPLHKVTEGKVIVIENFKKYKNTAFPTKFLLRSKASPETFEMNIDIPFSKSKKSYSKHQLNIEIDTSLLPLELIPMPVTEEEKQLDPTMFFKLNFSLINKTKN